LPSLEHPGPRFVLPRKWIAAVKAVTNESRFAGPCHGNVSTGQRNRHRLVPACSEAKASLACEDQQLDGCARASTTVAEVDERRRGSEKHDIPMANGSCGREPRLAQPRKGSIGSKRVDDRYHGGQAVEPQGARAGRLKGRRGAEVFVRWKALRVVFAGSFVHANGLGTISAALGKHASARAVAGARERRQECQRFVHARVATGRQRPPPTIPRGFTCCPPKRIVLT